MRIIMIDVDTLRPDRFMFNQGVINNAVFYVPQRRNVYGFCQHIRRTPLSLLV